MKGMVLDAKWEPKPDYEVSDWEKKTGKAITGNAIWHNPTLSVRDWPDPKPGPQEVLLQIQACGVCGSDMHFYETDKDNYILYPGLTRFPTILGHEFSGKVVEVGPEVTMLSVGDMVTVEEMIWCGRCTPCRNGYPNHCTNLEEIGFTIPGAFANFIAVDEKFCWKIDAIAERFGSEEMAYTIGALTEPSCVAYNAMFTRAGGFKPGHYVNVVGAGPIGLAAIGLAKAAGAGMIVAFEVSPKRMELAKAVGADFVYDPRKVSPGDAVDGAQQRRGLRLPRRSRWRARAGHPGDGEGAGNQLEDRPDRARGAARSHVPGGLPGAAVAGLRCPGPLWPREFPERNPTGRFGSSRSEPDRHRAL